MPPTQLHIAILDCDTPVPNVYAERGLYSDIFAALVRDALANTSILKEVDLCFSKYDCVLGHVPSEQDLLQTDVVIITGSAASAYDPGCWIVSLTSHIKNIYVSHPQIKLFGSCFGHQLLAHALFSTPNQPVVCRDPAGWELGVHPIALSIPFLTHFGPVTSNQSSPSSLRMQFVHADHVVIPPSLLAKEGFESIGRSSHCALQGIWKTGRVLTYQGHAEFDHFVNSETIKVFGKPIWTDSVLEDALRSVEKDDDALWAAEVMLRFFLEDVVERDDVRYGEVEELVLEEDVMARL